MFSRSVVAQESSGIGNAENGSVNITDEEKEQMKCNSNSDDGQSNESNRPFLDTVLYVSLSAHSSRSESNRIELISISFFVFYVSTGLRWIVAKTII